jgi:DNA-binding beta-propeller fold protein YncE
MPSQHARPLSLQLISPQLASFLELSEMDGGSSKDLKHEAPTSEQQDDRTFKRPRAVSHGVLVQQASDEYYDAEADEDDVKTEVTTGDGKTYKNMLPHMSTVLVLKQHLAHNAGFKPGQTCMFVDDNSREEELEYGERLGSLRRGKGLAVMITMMLEEADAQEMVPRLAAEADLVLGDGTAGRGTRSARRCTRRTWHETGDSQLARPSGVAFVPAHPDWVVTTELDENRVKISNIRTCAFICKFGEKGKGKGQFLCPCGVAVTSNSSFIIVADLARTKVLRLVVAADGNSAQLEFVCHMGNGYGSVEGHLNYPKGVALLPGEGGGQETVLVTEEGNHRVSQFKLDGTFIRIFAGTGAEGSGGGEFNSPCGITVLGPSGEVAVADCENHRVQIFDRDGNCKRQFGSFGSKIDGQLIYPAALASDAHGNLLVLDYTNRLQVFSAEGKHLCTRNDLGLKKSSNKDIAWSDFGELAVADGKGHQALLWHKT